jgi:transcriptional regulator with XRE-family HTH domain
MFNPEAVRELRKRLDLSLSQAASLIGASASAWCRWEEGNTVPLATYVGKMMELAKQYSFKLDFFKSTKEHNELTELVEGSKKQLKDIESDFEKSSYSLLQELHNLRRDFDEFRSKTEKGKIYEADSLEKRMEEEIPLFFQREYPEWRDKLRKVRSVIVSDKLEEKKRYGSSLPLSYSEEEGVDKEARIKFIEWINENTTGSDRDRWITNSIPTSSMTEINKETNESKEELMGPRNSDKQGMF